MGTVSFKPLESGILRHPITLSWFVLQRLGKLQAPSSNIQRSVKRSAIPPRRDEHSKKPQEKHQAPSSKIQSRSKVKGSN
jgi:hypothetical protein